MKNVFIGIIIFFDLIFCAAQKNEKKYFFDAIKPALQMDNPADSVLEIKLIDLYLNESDYVDSLKGYLIKNQVFKKGIYLYNSTYQSKYNNIWIFENCVFEKGVDFSGIDYNFEFKNCTFNNDLDIHNKSVFDKLFFKKCTFKGYFAMYGSCKISNLEIDNSTFYKPIEIYGMSKINYLSIKYSTLYDSFYADCQITEFEFEDINFSQTNETSKLADRQSENYIFSFFNPNFYSTISLINIKTDSLINPKKYVEIYGNYEKLLIEDCDFGKHNILLRNSIIKNDFTYINITHTGSLSMQWCTLPPENIDVDWNCLNNHRLSDFKNTDTLVLNGTNQQIFEKINARKFIELKATYKEFFELYKKRGEQNAANDCIIELKNIETEASKFEYNLNPSLNNYLNWKLNQFFGFFCRYGTDPVRAMIVSFYVILLFASIYFFFPIDDAALAEKGRVSKFLARFKSTKTKQDIDLSKPETSDWLLDFERHAAELPVAIQYLTFVFSTIIKFYLKSKLAFLSLFFKITNGGVPKANGFMGQLFAAIYFLLLLLMSLIKRILKSILLSLNAFATIGYGELSAVGVSRYFYVIEGVLGWILLTFFSVSLINQIL